MNTRVGRYVICALSLICALSASPVLSSERIEQEIDARPEGAEAAGFVLFSWQDPDQGEAAHVLIAGGENPAEGDFAAGFGLWNESDGATAGPVDPEAFSRLHTSRANALLVQVDARQLEGVQTTLEEFVLRSGTAEGRFEDCFYRVVSALGLEAPYRGTFGVGNPYADFADLARLNR